MTKKLEYKLANVLKHCTKNEVFHEGFLQQM